MVTKKMEESTENILKNLHQERRKKQIKTGVSVTLVLILIGIIVFLAVSYLSYRYWQSPEIQLQLGAEIEKVSFSRNMETAYIKLRGGSNLYNITKVKFSFLDAQDKTYNYDTTEGITEIEVPYKKTLWEIIIGIFGFKPRYPGTYNYDVNSDEIGIEDFYSIKEISVLFEYETETGEIVETPKLDTEKTTTKTTTTGGGDGGGGGNGGTTTCTTGEWTDTNNYRCNSENNQRERKQTRSICPSGTEEQWIVEECPTNYTCYDGIGAPADLCINESKICVDSDEINYYIQGNVTLDLLSFSFDECSLIDSNVTEYYCYFNGISFEIKNESYTCNYGCIEGACSLPACIHNDNCSVLNDACARGICNLTTNMCQQSFNSSSTICRTALGECDLEESCTGSSENCPINVFKHSGAACSLGICDGNGKCVVVSENVYSTNEDTPINIILFSSITGNWTRTTSPSHGAIANKTSLNNINFVNLTYTPSSNYNGEDYFKYNVTDGVSSEIINVTIIINPVNDAPVLIYDSVAVFGIDASAGSEIHTYTIKARDVENDPVTFSYTSSNPPTNANLNPSTGEFSFTANAGDLNDNYAITFKANDGELNSSSGTVNIRMREAKEYYIRKGSTGNGSDWDNAFDNLSAVESLYGGLVRGATYWIADGEYGDYRFNDPIDRAKYITIKKAVDNVRCSEIGKTPVECHGSAGDWQDSYGDNIALFTTSDAPESGIIWFETSYYIFDGQVGGGPGSWDSGHGFKINSTAPFHQGNYPSIYLMSFNDWIGTGAAKFVNISHVELQHRGVNTPDVDCGIFYGGIGYSDSWNKTTRETFLGNPGTSNIVVDHSYLHDFGWVAVQTKQSSGWLFEYNYVARTTSSAGICIDDLDGDDMGYCRRQFVDEDEPRECNLTLGLRENPVCPRLHGEGWQDFGSDNMVIRYNIWEDIEGTAVLGIKHDITDSLSPPGADETYYVNDNWEIYGNVFFYSPENPYDRIGTGHGVVGATAWNDAGSNNFSFYNNIVINWPGWNSGLWLEYGTGNKIYNNIWYNCTNYVYGGGRNVIFEGEDIDYDYNIYIDSPLGTKTTREGTYAAEHDIETTGDPFVDWVNLNFSLKEPSEAGIILQAPYNYDMFGIERGIDNSWDRGAVEYTLSCSFDSDCNVLDNLPCADYYCDTSKSICIRTDTDGTSCNDWDECTYNDNCFGGDCFGTQISCSYYIDPVECEESICSSCEWNLTICQETVLPKDYIAYWKFDTQASGITPDETGVHDGTLINEALIESDAERANVLGLDGDRDYVYLGTHQSLNLTNQTLTAWFKLDEIAGNNFLFSDGYLYFSISNRDIYLLYRNSSGGVKHCDDYYIDAEAGKWYHIAATYEISGDDLEINLYLNGTLEQRCEISEGFIPYPIISLGARHLQAGGLNGSIDEVMIYDRELSAEEILKIYEAQKDVEGGDGGEAGSMSPFTQLLNFLKSLLTGKTGKAILTGNAVGDGSFEDNKPFVIFIIAVVIIVLIIIVIKAKKIKKRKRRK